MASMHGGVPNFSTAKYLFYDEIHQNVSFFLNIVLTLTKSQFSNCFCLFDIFYMVK